MGDLTCISTPERWLHVAVMLDLVSLVTSDRFCLAASADGNILFTRDER